VNANNLIPESDTETALAPAAGTQGSRFVKTRYANLVKDQVSGKYHARAKVGGRLIRKSLKTGSIEVAKRKLDDLLAQERARRNIHGAEVDGWRMGRLADCWMAELKADKDLKPRTVEYREETLAIIRKTWPGFDVARPMDISPGECRDWAKRLGKKYSGSRFNGCVESLRAIFRLAQDQGSVATNPALLVERKAVKRKVRNLPSISKFRELLGQLKKTPWRRRASALVRFLVFSGARPAAALMVVPADVDLKANTLRLPPIKHQHEPLVLPMSKELRGVVKELLADSSGPNEPLLPTKTCRKALKMACRELNLPRLTHYDLRHLFTTHLLENGVAPAVVAALRGDKDGGAMLLKTYFHAREEAKRKAMAKAKF
jgi:integrase